MKKEKNIFELLKKEDAHILHESNHAVIIQSGAVGDCILTLPLAGYLKKALNLGRVDILGHMDYISYFPGRTCIDTVRSIDAIELHKLFVDHKDFDLPDNDPLIRSFSDYSWVISFLAEPGSSFEQNLIFTVHCSKAAEVVSMQMIPPPETSTHIVDFYLRQFIEQSGLNLRKKKISLTDKIINAGKSDVAAGKGIIKNLIPSDRPKLVIIHPGSGSVQKCWFLENYLNIARELLAKGFAVLFMAGPTEKERFSSDDFSRMKSIASVLSDLSLHDCLNVLSNSFAFIGNDSGLAHMAGGLGIKTAVLFGPTNPNIYKSLGPDVIVFEDASVNFTADINPQLQTKIINYLTKSK